MGMAHSNSTPEVAMRDIRHYFGTVPVMLVLMPMLTPLSNRKPSLLIATAEKSVCDVLAAETEGVTAVLVSMRVIVPVSGSPPTSTLFALTSRSQVEKVIVAPVCGPLPAAKALVVTVKVHEPKLTPPLAIAAEPNWDKTNNVGGLPDEGTKVKETGLPQMLPAGTGPC